MPNRVNFLVNGDFRRTTTNYSNANYAREFPDSWTKGSGVSTAYRNRVILSKDANLGLPAGVKGNALQFYSRPTRNNVAYGQYVNVAGVKGDTFVQPSGDIIGIVDASGNLVVEYKYDT